MSSEAHLAEFDIDQRVEEIERELWGKTDLGSSTRSRFQGARQPPSAQSNTSYKKLTTVRTRTLSNPDYISKDGSLEFKTISGNRYVIKKRGGSYSTNLIGWPEVGSQIEIISNDAIKSSYTVTVQALFVATAAASGEIRFGEFMMNA